MVNLTYSGTLLSNTKAELNSSLTSSAMRVNFVGLPGAALPAQAHTPSSSLKIVCSHHVKLRGVRSPLTTAIV